MTGYNDFSMSNNAVAAYADGVKPLSKITIADLRAAGWQSSKALAVRLTKAGIWTAAEWHHSSKYFNRVDFYDPAELVEAWNNLDEPSRRDHLAARPADVNAVRVSGVYVEWGGSRRRPRRLRDVEFTGDLLGDWIYLDAGGRKKASGNHVTWRPLKPPTRRAGSSDLNTLPAPGC